MQKSQYSNISFTKSQIIHEIHEFSIEKWFRGNGNEFYVIAICSVLVKIYILINWKLDYIFAVFRLLICLHPLRIEIFAAIEIWKWKWVLKCNGTFSRIPLSDTSIGIPIGKGCQFDKWLDYPVTGDEWTHSNCWLVGYLVGRPSCRLSRYNRFVNCVTICHWLPDTVTVSAEKVLFNALSVGLQFCSCSHIAIRRVVSATQRNAQSKRIILIFIDKQDVKVENVIKCI